MPSQLIRAISGLFDIKNRRKGLLEIIYKETTAFDFDVTILKDVVLSDDVDYRLKGFCLQILSKVAQYQPVKRDAILKFVKKYLSEKVSILNPSEDEIFIIESILFFLFITEKNSLLDINFENKELSVLRTRFLFADDKLNRKFFVPSKDILQNKRFSSFDRVIANITESGDVDRFRQFRDILIFTAKFPFVNDIEFIKSWAGVKSDEFLEEVINSRIFIHDGNYLIYDPVERARIDKFVHTESVRDELFVEVKKRFDYKQKKVIFDRFVDDFLKMTDILMDSGVCIIGFAGQLLFNTFAKEKLGLTGDSKPLFESIKANYIESKTKLERFVIGGFSIESRISELLVESCLIGYVVVLKDVTDDEIFKRFTSHDIKNSLLSALSAFKLLEDNDKLDEMERKLLNSGKNSVAKLREKVAELLSFKNDTINFESSVSLKEIISGCILAHTPDAKRKDISLIYDSEDIRIRCDRKKIYRVIENLVSNAIKYSQTGKDVLISTELAVDSVSILVKDRGFGIDASYGDNIFKIGKRLERDKNMPGSGVGLAVVKKFVDMHSGEISYSNNTDGDGTTFVIKLPLNN